MIDILNLAVPYFGLILIGYACGKAVALTGVMWFIQSERLAFP